MMRRLFVVLTLLALAACAPPGGHVRPDAMPLELDDARYAVTIQPGAAGTGITAAGAGPIAGRTVRVTRLGTPLSQDEGLAAKRAARAECTRSNGRFNEVALGSYRSASGAWVFPGGCA